jgi:hypothetical protein
MICRVHAGLHEVNRPEGGGVIDEHFNHALTLVAVIARGYWILVYSDGATATIGRSEPMA